MMQTDSSYQSAEIAMLGLRCGNKVFAVPEQSLLRIDKVGEIAPYPGAPHYILGVTEKDGIVYTVIQADRLNGLPGANESIASEQCVVGLLINDEIHHSIILAGEQAVSVEGSFEEDFDYLELPKACMLEASATPTQIAFKALEL